MGIHTCMILVGNGGHHSGLFAERNEDMKNRTDKFFARKKPQKLLKVFGAKVAARVGIEPTTK